MYVNVMEKKKKGHLMILVILHLVLVSQLKNKEGSFMYQLYLILEPRTNWRTFQRYAYRPLRNPRRTIYFKIFFPAYNFRNYPLGNEPAPFENTVFPLRITLIKQKRNVLKEESSPLPFGFYISYYTKFNKAIGKTGCFSH